MLDFKDKKVTIMGLGLYGEGSGISATKFLIKRGAKVLVTDLKTKEQLKDQIKRLGVSAKKIEFVLGEHREKDFKNADLIVRNPGVPRNSPYLKMARENNIPIENDISLFFQLVDRKRIIGITGTRGKSTVASLIYKIIKVVDKNAVLGGNIAKSPLAQMPEVKKGSAVVLELSSWLIEELEGHHLSPHIAVVTNIYPDHLNTYKDIDDYALAKETIWRWQTCQDYVILNRDNKNTLDMGRRVPSQRFWFSLKKFKEE
ncbi:UDP-N-acetylmuramoyl-L-alanine--D-glutamate ligase, partial [Candidatus Falkowbacteria bacterium]|nr:UDP-N-acetylmuramoyl-L-alanine--D-glutamate ligase [Candidatus Falkowbacteria bacterium]